MIFPEGCTTNNSQIIQFKKGAFVSEASIQPIAMKYGGYYSSPSHDVIDIFSHFYILTGNPYITLHIKEYPVFKPNQYFWDKYWKKD